MHPGKLSPLNFFIKQLQDWISSQNQTNQQLISAFHLKDPLFIDLFDQNLIHLAKKVQWHNENHLNQQDFWELQQTSMFGSNSYIGFRGLSGQSAKLLKSIHSAQDIVNPLIFVIASPSIPTSLSKELKRLKATIITEPKIRSFELASVAKDLAKARGLSLSPQTSRIIEEYSPSLNLLNNEFKKLALILGTNANAQIDSTMISKYLEIIPSQAAFEIDRLLTAKKYGKVHMEIDRLLTNGDNPIAILGILAKHIRTVIRISTKVKSQENLQSIANDLRLPMPVIKGYNQLIRQLKTIHPYCKALTLCQQSDMSLKSSKVAHELNLHRIVQCLYESKN